MTLTQHIRLSLPAILLSVIMMATSQRSLASGTNAESDSITVRPVTSAFAIEAGSSHLADTYLTPLRYRGTRFAFDYRRRQAMAFDPEHWEMSLGGAVGINRDENPAKNATMWGLDFNLSWSMTHRWHVAPQVNVGVGGMTKIDAGVLYLARNGNNPCSAKGAWQLGAEAFASWRLSLGRLPLTLTYDVRMPLTGVFFTPDYGQLYYELWLGERDGLVSGMWLGNYFALDNRVLADLHFGATTLRLGYHLDITSTKARGIVSRDVSHTAIVGIVCDWLSIDRRRGLSPHTRIITASY